MTLDRSYIGYLGLLGIDFLKSVLKYSKGAICLSRLLFKMGLFTVKRPWDLKPFVLDFLNRSSITFWVSLQLLIRRGAVLWRRNTATPSNKASLHLP